MTSASRRLAPSVSASSTLSAWPKRDQDGRTRQRVRRNSREAWGQERAELLTPRQRRERMAAFRRHATNARPAGKRRGSGGSYSLYCGDVLDYLMHYAVTSGRIFPSYKQIAAAVGCAYRTAVRCIAQLKRGGWLTWERRFVRVANGGALEPQVHQESNLYRLALPNVARQLIDAWASRPRPKPADVDDEWTAHYASGETEAALQNAILEAERGAQRRNQHLLLKLAGARTIGEVERALTSAHRTRAILETLEAGLAEKGAVSASGQREFP